MRFFSLALIIAQLLLLAACGRGVLLSDVTTTPSTITPNGDGLQEATTISYRVGQPATVTIWLEGAGEGRYVLRDAAPRTPSTQPYELRFDGTVPQGPDERRILPDGSYTLVVQARASDGASAEQRSQLTISDAKTSVPEIQNLSVLPNTFSPNEDAIDDVVHFTYQIPVTATVSIHVTDQQGRNFPIVTRQEEGPGTRRNSWSGKTLEGALLPSGSYTYTITADDEAGNRVVQRGSLTIADAGQTEARILDALIGPANVMWGYPITITVRVKNTGDVPIRTFGPPSGFRYSTRDSYGSVDEHTWADRGGGYWRLGLGFEGNGNAYPFRWALSERPPEQWKVPGVEDWLDPGEEVEVTGSVTIYQFEDRMTFFVGLIHEGVQFAATRQHMKVIEVGLP